MEECPLASKYTLYIDESGEAGISKIRSSEARGASPYMVLGAALIPSVCETSINERLSRIADKLGKEFLHCNKLNHQQKVYFSREVSRERFLAFGVISYKDTLKAYSDAINKSSDLYYNKCSQYLLEKVSLFMHSNDENEGDIDIVFETGNFDYESFKNLIRKCQKSPIYKSTKLLRYIDTKKITSKSKSEESLLQLPDLVAHALYKCVDKNDGNYGIPEPRYLNELKSKFFQDTETGKIDGYGLKAVHNLKQLSLDPEILQIMRGTATS